MTTRINLGSGAGKMAYNRCCGCAHEWQDKPMGYAHHLVCPACGSEYWQWLNYAASEPRRVQD